MSSSIYHATTVGPSCDPLSATVATQLLFIYAPTGMQTPQAPFHDLLPLCPAATSYPCPPVYTPLPTAKRLFLLPRAAALAPTAHAATTSCCPSTLHTD
ncbi:hypothetical protein CRG98_035100 [Punica granatum]|uniref:Uncharacterized protein n=1 Tax=Punica granatum TaxID=22663 RepID=A0A2I0IL80_PUNGR|nr:hypothetical protein CRG98_035100 [Punica granatum]